MRLKNKEIAKRLGISATAVSLALNNKAGVSEETRQKVLKLAGLTNTSPTRARHATEPNQSLLLSIHKKTGKIIDDKPFFTNLIETIQQEAMNYQYGLTVTHYLPGMDIDQYISYISAMPVSGILILGTEIDHEDFEKYERIGIPCVLLDASFDTKSVNSVEIDNRGSVLRSMKYAVSMGHRNIGYLKSDTPIENFRHRLSGYWEGLHQFDLIDGNHPIIELPCSIDGAYEGMKEYLKHRKNAGSLPDAFLADLDYIAIGAMRALKEAGYRIPEDISIIGYDNLALCLVSDPPLTSVSVSQADIGRMGVKILLYKIEELTTSDLMMTVGTDLVIRSSVSDIRAKKGALTVKGKIS